jgi:tRNA A37 threonylcarbamoyladenosine synthetase subunit TsaC/SUA5/YrdC
MPLFDIAADAARAFSALEAGGIAIVPNTIGYSILGGSGAALKRIFAAKKRAASKLNAMVANMDIHREVHVCTPRGRDIVRAIVEDYNLPLGCIAPARLDHPILRKLDPEALDGSTKDATVVMLLNAGRFHAALTKLSHERTHPLFGSSANLTLSGTKFRAEDIEEEIKAIADVIVDHGLQPFHPYGASSTLINVETFQVVRHGSCFEDIAYILKRHFGVELPGRPT